MISRSLHFATALLVVGWLVAVHQSVYTQLSEPAVTSRPEGATTWFCPMHSDVTAPIAGKCSKCGMALVKGNPFDTRDYKLAVISSTPKIESGRTFRLHLTVRDPRSGEVVKDFESVHDKRYHLFVISHDMQEFQHIHPEQQNDGSWMIDVLLGRPGYYRILSDFLPSGASPQFLGHTIVTAGFDGDLTTSSADLQPDSEFTKIAGSIVADLAFSPERLIAGEFGHLEYTLTDVRTKKPVEDLQPYLGAFGHTLIMSEDMVTSVHSHPSEWVAGAGEARTTGGPRVVFEGYMPRAGDYRAWTQFLRGGELITVSFSFRVLTLSEAMALGR